MQLVAERSAELGDGMCTYNTLAVRGNLLVPVALALLLLLDLLVLDAVSLLCATLLT